MQIMFSRLVVSPFSVSPTLSSSSANNSNKIFVIYLLITLTSVQLIDAYCEAHHWWQQELGKCLPCSVCDASQSIVLRPCQAHLDTVCGTLEDLELELDWLKSAVSVHHNRIEASQQIGVIERSTAAMLMWDWQSLSLLVAGVMCLLFFLVAAYIYWQHSRYWKKLEQMERGYNAVSNQQLERKTVYMNYEEAEAEELSSRLMHTIIDIRSDENGRVVLEEAKRDKVTNPFDLQCIYFEDLLDNGNNSRVPVPKPLIKINPEKQRKLKQPEVAVQSTSVIKDQPIENEAIQKQGRGNCYTEPMHPNCVTSELYLIT